MSQTFDVSPVPDRMQAGPPNSEVLNHPEFRSPQADLYRSLDGSLPPRSSLGKTMDDLISHRHHGLRKPDSWTASARPFAAWKEVVQRELRESLALENALGENSQPTLLGRFEHRDYVEEHVEIAVTGPLRAPAIVTIPRNGKNRHPALVLLHCLGSNVLYGKEKFLQFSGEPAYLTAYRNQHYSGRSLLAEFARAGYLCIAIDAIGFGGRSLPGDQDFAAFDIRRQTLPAEMAENWSLQIQLEQWDQWSRGLGVVGLSPAALLATDDLRTVDYLASRSDVDPGRLACAGLSMGSFRSHYLAAMDDRIRAAVSVCWLSTFTGIVDYNIRHSMGHFALPSRFYSRFDMVDIAAACAPKPFLALSGWNDILMEPRGIAEAHLILRNVWAAAGHPETLGSWVADAPHEFNEEMQRLSVEFLFRHL